ncbi:hypothetical protein K3G63_05210 [Hymenobacter sp. HSC-4F20]|nr:hypothetical protein [Hymenobacter sp. HSC-4F20]MBX0289825.1 hypothetical protein [Hymenobacter sp. HSC-4F20]
MRTITKLSSLLLLASSLGALAYWLRQLQNLNLGVSLHDDDDIHPDHYY